MSASDQARAWRAERRAAVRWLRWKASQDERSGNDHEARLVRGLARCIEKGQHCMEGPPAIPGLRGDR